MYNSLQLTVNIVRTSEKILRYISSKRQVSVHELVDYLELSRMAVSRRLANLIAEGKLVKIGKPPKVFYSLTKGKEKTKNIAEVVDSDIEKIIENNFLIIYNTEDGETRIEVMMKGETVWLSQKQMAELFDCSVDNIGLHLKNIYFEGELAETPTSEESSVVQIEGSRRINRPTKLYNLDVIISVGYRINSLRGTQFRIWATQKLKEYMLKGFVMDDERLSEGHVRKTYFEEWEERIRRIRTSEANFYQKVRDVFATSADYNPKMDYAKQFFATVQNKFHYAITGFTAAEIIAGRIDCQKENLGMTNWKGKIITRDQAQIAKNYLAELELKRLNLLVEQFLSFAELQSVEQRVMYMKDWIQKLDDFLILNEKEILQNAGNVSHLEMEKRVRDELAKYNQKRLKNEH